MKLILVVVLWAVGGGAPVAYQKTFASEQECGAAAIAVAENMQATQGLGKYEKAKFGCSADVAKTLAEHGEGAGEASTDFPADLIPSP